MRRCLLVFSTIAVALAGVALGAALPGTAHSDPPPSGTSTGAGTTTTSTGATSTGAATTTTATTGTGTETTGTGQSSSPTDTTETEVFGKTVTTPARLSPMAGPMRPLRRAPAPTELANTGYKAGLTALLGALLLLAGGCGYLAARLLGDRPAGSE
jgi:hypothetical protein